MPLTNDIIQGNKLIAEFMGGFYVNTRQYDKEDYHVEVYNDAFEMDNTSFHGKPSNPIIKKTLVKKIRISALEYHASWDWLMPVVKKINDLCSERGGELSNHSRDQEHLSNQLDNPLHWKSWSYHYITLSTDIDIVWKKTVSFIQWYNTQNH